MGRQRRVESVVVDTDPGYSVGTDPDFKSDLGDHGYDNYFPTMNVSKFFMHARTHTHCFN